ncbi:helix-turn-helix domain-containing protein [Achromobacter aloeverae]|uniref:HTH cro/C1-type domain-containing protein n=1 Tax=Achromobacter aloeverae TaxID=1750518 RepID=A0A4Q1HJB0_9BURK|nr:helix-turn-helix transcriptional regulator [Achromobacter aloeverae]RXN90166.1 hypothetical protein C7R54_11570 [Achromobacter aloeverae]
MNIADRLSSLMRWRGIRSQRHLARLSGVPQTSIHRILANRPGYLPSIATVARLARALSVNPEWLHGDGPAARLRGLARAQASEGPQGQEGEPHGEQRGDQLGKPQGRRQPWTPRPISHGEDDVAEMKRLMATLTAAERRKIIAVVRLVAQGRLPSTSTAGAARLS